MGRSSSLRRLNRDLAEREAEKMRTAAQLDRPAGRVPARNSYEEISQRPEIIAAHEAADDDEGLQERWRSDLPGQRRRLTRAGFRQAFEGSDGAGGWMHPRSRLKVLHSVARETDGNLWGHVSLSYYQSDALAGWQEMRDANRLLYPGLFGVQVIAPASDHVTLFEVLHVWTCLTAAVLPDFGRYGTI